MRILCCCYSGQDVAHLHRWHFGVVYKQVPQGKTETAIDLTPWFLELHNTSSAVHWKYCKLICFVSFFTLIFYMQFFIIFLFNSFSLDISACLSYYLPNLRLSFISVSSASHICCCCCNSSMIACSLLHLNYLSLSHGFLNLSLSFFSLWYKYLALVCDSCSGARGWYGMVGMYMSEVGWQSVHMHICK